MALRRAARGGSTDAGGQQHHCGGQERGAPTQVDCSGTVGSLGGAAMMHVDSSGTVQQAYGGNADAGKQQRHCGKHSGTALIQVDSSGIVAGEGGCTHAGGQQRHRGKDGAGRH